MAFASWQQAWAGRRWQRSSCASRSTGAGLQTCFPAIQCRPVEFVPLLLSLESMAFAEVLSWLLLISCVCVSCCCLTYTSQPGAPCRHLLSAEQCWCLAAASGRGMCYGKSCSAWTPGETWTRLPRSSWPQPHSLHSSPQEMCLRSAGSWLHASSLLAVCPAEPGRHPSRDTLHVCVATAGRPSLSSCFQVA